MWVWICVVGCTAACTSRNAGIAQSRYFLCQSDLRSGSFSRNAASSIWMTRMPARSRSSTSSRIANASCLVCSSLETSSRGHDQLRIVTGPVSMPLTTWFVRLCAYELQATVIGSRRETSPQTIGGLTQRVP